MIKNVSVNVKTINEAMAQSVINVSKTCSAIANNRVSIRVGKVDGDVYIGGSVTQKAESNLRCEQSSDIQASLKSEMLNNIKASAAATDMNWATGDFAFETNVRVDMLTMNKTIMTSDVSDAMECYNIANDDYNVEFGNVGGNFTFNTKIDQNAKSKVEECLQKSGITANLAQAIKNDLTASASAKGTLASVADALGQGMIAIVVVCVLGVVLVGLLKFLGKVKKPPPKGIKAALSAVLPDSVISAGTAALNTGLGLGKLAVKAGAGSTIAAAKLAVKAGALKF
jgi:hypothetical protein